MNRPFARMRTLLSHTLLALLALALPGCAGSPGLEEEAKFGSVTEKHMMIPMRDGKSLSAYLYFPEGAGPWPVLYEQRYADLRRDRTREDLAELASHGYIVCAENFRGTHRSDGTVVPDRYHAWRDDRALT